MLTFQYKRVTYATLNHQRGELVSATRFFKSGGDNPPYRIQFGAVMQWKREHGYPSGYFASMHGQRQRSTFPNASMRFSCFLLSVRRILRRFDAFFTCFSVSLPDRVPKKNQEFPTFRTPNFRNPECWNQNYQCRNF